MKKHFLFSYIALLCISLSLSAQSRFDFEYYGNYNVIIDNDTLKNPWSGGLYQGQFHQFDLNNNGIADLIIFDKYGNRILPFLRATQNGTPTWVYAPEYIAHFPAAKYFIAFVDYNCDGKKDMFTQNDAGVLVFTNTTTGNTPSFSPAISGNLQTRYLGQTFINNLFVPNSDNPVIADVNGDGIVDILTFSVSGIAVGMHKGMQPCGLQFEEVDDCWGNFTEGLFDGSIYLNSCSTSNKRSLSPADFPEFTKHQLDSIRKTEHAGSAMLTLDLTDNGLPDLLIADIDQKNITALFNGGTLDSAHMTSKDAVFPVYDFPVHLNIFPASFYTDLDFDGVNDLIVTPNLFGHNNTDNVWFYKNKGTNTLPNFEFQDSTSWHKEIIDLGRESYPVLYDLDGDGLQDLIVSSYGKYQSAGVYDSRLYFFKNVGTATEPAFELVNDNLANIPQYQIGYMPAPTFGDINGNGRPDMILGDEAGNIHFFTNTGTTNNPQFTLTTPNLNNIQVPGGKATPFLYDLSGNGALDLLVGNVRGTVHYYERASSGQLQFNLVTERFGGVNMLSSVQIGASNPVVVEHNGKPSLFVGSHGLGVYHYDSLQYIVNKPAVISGTLANGNAVAPDFEITPFGTSKRTGRNQYLYRASDLIASGLEYGKFSAISFQVSGNPDAFTFQNNLRIAMKHTNANSVNGFDDNDWTNVVNARVTLEPGWNKINLPNEFLWNGVDNLLIEVCFERNILGPDLLVTGEVKNYAATGFGDITNFNTLLAKGCEMPYKGNSTFLPKIMLEVIPSLRLVDAFLGDGIYNYVAVGELTGDTFPEVIVGNGSGGLHFYRGIAFDYSSISTEDFEVQPTGLKAYPNPNNGLLTLALEVTNTMEATVVLFDLQGREVIRTQWYAETPTIDIQQLANGVYILHCIVGEQMYYSKIIKQ